MYPSRSLGSRVRKATQWTRKKVVGSSSESSRARVSRESGEQRSEREKKWWRAVAKARESKGNAVNAKKSGGEQWRKLANPKATQWTRKKVVASSGERKGLSFTHAFSQSIIHHDLALLTVTSTRIENKGSEDQGTHTQLFANNGSCVIASSYPHQQQSILWTWVLLFQLPTSSGSLPLTK